MKVFQELRTAIDSWEEDGRLILKIESILNCSKSEIMGKIEQLQNARPANDLSAINDKLKEMQDLLTDAYQRAEDTQQQVENAQSELEYVDSNDATCAIDDVSAEFSDFREEIKKQLNSENE